MFYMLNCAVFYRKLATVGTLGTLAAGSVTAANAEGDAHNREKVDAFISNLNMHSCFRICLVHFLFIYL